MANAQLVNVLQHDLSLFLAKRFDLESEKVSEAIGEFLWGAPKKSKKQVQSKLVNSDEKLRAQHPEGKKTVTEGGTCTAKLKKGDTLCTKKASVFVGGQGFCGTHKPKEPKEGDVKTDTSKPKKSQKTPNEKPKTKLPTKKGNLKDNQEVLNKRLSSLVKKAIVPPEIRTIKVGDRVMDVTTRLLFTGNKIYGKLADDDDTILPLEEEDHAIIDGWRLSTCSTPLNEKEENSREATAEADEVQEVDEQNDQNKPSDQPNGDQDSQLSEEEIEMEFES
jgi:hypothetical protein